MIDFIGLKNIKPEKTIKYNSVDGFKHIDLAQKPDTFVRANSTTCPIAFTGKSNRLNEYKKITDDLKQTADNAQASLDNQRASDSWAGKTADAISILWNSKNRATLVQADIDTYKEQVCELDSSIKDDKFNDKFKKMFDVEYNHANIVKYKRKSKQFETALTADCIAKYTDEKLSKNIQLYNKLSGKLQDLKELVVNKNAVSGTNPCYTQVTKKEEIFENMENSLIEVLGDKNVLEKILTANGLDAQKASNEDKYKVYGYLSNFIVEKSKASAQKCLNGQALSQIKEDCDKSYEKAFGTKNDIIARVDKYNASQKAGASCITFIANVILNTLGPNVVMANVAYSAATSVAMDVIEAKSKKNKDDLNLKAIAINAGMNAVCGGVNQSIVNKYSGSVASKILAGQPAPKNIGAKLTDFVVREIVSKEGVKLPAYAIEAVSKSIIQSLTGIKPAEDGVGISQTDLDNTMTAVSIAMAYLGKNAKNSNLRPKDLVKLLENHIKASMKDNNEFIIWLNKNQASIAQILNQLVKVEQ